MSFSHNIECSGKWVAITPENDATITVPHKGLWIGDAGNLVVKDEKGTTITFTGLLANTHIPIRVSEVRATSTTCTVIYGIH